MSNKEIHRYKMDNTNDLGYAAFCRVDLPKGAKIVNVSYVGGDIHLHAIVNPNHKKKERWFAVFTEGTPLEDYDKKTFDYIGMTHTVPTYHIFEVHD